MHDPIGDQPCARVPERMDDVEPRIEAFWARTRTSSVGSQIDALADIERLNDPRIAPFLLDVLADRRAPREVRIVCSCVLKRLRNGGF